MRRPPTILPGGNDTDARRGSIKVIAEVAASILPVKRGVDPQ